MVSKNQIIEYFIEHPTATNQDIAAALGTSRSTVQRCLSNPDVGNITIPSLGITISEQIQNNIIHGRRKGGRNTFQRYDAKKDESGHFIGLVKEPQVMPEKEELKREDVKSIVLFFSKNPYMTIDNIALSLSDRYTPDYVYKCLTDYRVVELFGPVIANAVIEQLDKNRYGILRKFESNWGEELFEQAGLTEQEKEILRFRFSKEGIRSSEAAAIHFEVSKTTIINIENRALQKVQDYQEGIGQK